MTRYAVRSTAGGMARASPSTVCSTGRPAAVNDAVSAGNWARPTVGSVGAVASSGARSRLIVVASSSRAAAAGGAHLGDGLFGLLGLFVEDVARDAGLDADQRDVVADEVVQVAGDAQAFLADPAAGLFLAGLLCPHGAGFDLGDVGAAVARGLAGGDRGEGDRTRGGGRLGGVRRAEAGDDAEHGNAEQAEPDRAWPGGARDGGADGDQAAEQERWVPVRADDRHRFGDQRDREYGARPATAKHQCDADRGRAQHDGQVGHVHEVFGVGERFGQGDRVGGDRDQDVDGQGMRADAPPPSAQLPADRHCRHLITIGAGSIRIVLSRRGISSRSAYCDRGSRD